MAWEDFSMSATVVPFDPPVPLLRGPVAAGLADEPSSRSFVLAFRDAGSWRAAFRATESKIAEQCEAGARAGCSISVSNTCKLPWWRIILGAKSMDFAEREQCEEREMLSCMAPAKAACSKFAREKCIPAFQEARIMARGSTTYKGNHVARCWRQWISRRHEACNSADSLGIVQPSCSSSDFTAFDTTPRLIS